MANPLYSLFGNSQFGNMAGLVQQFNQFKNAFKGDPRQQVQQLLNSGAVSQQQYNQAVQQAQALQQILSIKH